MNPGRLIRRACMHLGTLCIVFLGACTSAPSARNEATASGPFEIVADSHRVSAPGPDMRPFQTRRVDTFTLKYRGQLLTFDEAPGVAGGKAGPGNEVLEKAYFLDRPGGPAALVGTRGGTFVVTEQQGQAVVTRLLPFAFDGYQWLDSAAGHPGPVVYVSVEAGREPRTLSGGKLLLLLNGGSSKLGVLDVAKLRFQTLLNPDPAKRKSQDFYPDGFRVDGGMPGKVRELSPGRSQFVQVAVKYVADKPQYAFVVVDFRKSGHALVPLDVDATRLNTFRKMTPEWMARYYEWTRGKDGTERFSVRDRPAPMPWTGYFTDRHAESPQYRLQPVSGDMMAAFANYLETGYGAVRLLTEQRSMSLRIGADSFELKFYPDSQLLSFAPALNSYTESAIAACETIAAGFDRQLAGGAHQALFTHLAAHQIWPER